MVNNPRGVKQIEIQVMVDKPRASTVKQMLDALRAKGGDLNTVSFSHWIHRIDIPGCPWFLQSSCYISHEMG